MSSVVYCESLSKLISQGRAVGASGKVFELGALSTKNNLEILSRIVLDRGVSESLEIGLAFGGSALAILGAMRAKHGLLPFKHTAIDPFQRTVWDSVAVGLIAAESFDQNFTLIEEPSSLALPSLVKHGGKYQLIYIDGSHLCEDVFVDMYFAIDLLDENGIVVFDDCCDKHVAKVIKFVRTNLHQVLEEVDLDRFGEATSFRKQVARALGYRQAVGFRRTSQSRRPWNARFVGF